MLSCKDASRLLAESGEARPAFGRRLALRMHLLLCRLCRRHARQMMSIDEVARGYARRVEANDRPDAPDRLPDDARERIRSALRDARP